MGTIYLILWQELQQLADSNLFRNLVAAKQPLGIGIRLWVTTTKRRSPQNPDVLPIPGNPLESNGTA